ncbi:MAG: hypothetical protein K2N15_14620 [Lachnospiraceae bacterium]|nr:hypothetical protein [Lachnospiraceae bacterium]
MIDMKNLISEYNSTELLGGIRLILYEKKIVYLSLYQGGMKKASAGFVKLSRERDEYLLDIHIKNGTGIRDGEYAICVAGQSREIDWGTITLQSGRADEKRRFYVREGYARFGEEEFEEDDLRGILIQLDAQQWIAGYWRETEHRSVPMERPDLCAADERTANKEIEDEKTVEEDRAREIAVNEAKGNDAADDKSGILPEAACEDKWEQLLRCYKKVHPFGDDRVFLSVEPKDFIILQAPYQRLVNNSFLLHGFYNYRHMILGPDKEIGDGDGTCFYLGVPGTYFEREKMVAIMFGFEGFECDGAVEVGKFGYYMRRVEL